MLYDAASTINSVIVLVEDLLALGVAPAEVRSRVFDGWLAEHPSNAAFAAHTDGLLELADGDHAAGGGGAVGRARGAGPVPGQAR